MSKNFSQDIAKLDQLISQAKTILVLQPEKPDTDSLASALVLEGVFAALGKQAIMYCQDEIPQYIRLLDGWDRVTDKFPDKFDITILVDTGGPQMIARTLEKHGPALAKQPFVIIDHHGSRQTMPLETINVVDAECAANTELLYQIGQELKWEFDDEAIYAIAAGILADTSSFTNSNTTPRAVRVIADLAERGLNLPEFYTRRRSVDALSPELVNLKGKLLQRAEFHLDGQAAINYATPEELKLYADIHDPADLVTKEVLLFTDGVLVSAFLRDYGGKIKGSIRSSIDGADKIAEHFGGGGHPRAAGFRVDDRPLDEVKQELIKALKDILVKDAAIRHP